MTDDAPDSGPMRRDPAPGEDPAPGQAPDPGPSPDPDPGSDSVRADGPSARRRYAAPAPLPEPRLTPEQQRELARARRAARWVGLILPLAVIAVACALLAVWLPRMPDPAATHWGFTGGPDGFGAPSTFLWLTLGLGGGMTVLLSLMTGLSGLKPGAPMWSSAQRFLAAFAAGFAVFFATVGIASAAVQLDLAEAADAPGIGGYMGLGFGAWIVVGLVAWAVQPRADILMAPEAPSAALELASTERAVWFGRVRPSRVYSWLAGFAAVSMVLAVAIVFASPAPAAVQWVMVGALVIVVGLLAVSAGFRVRVDAAGLVARSVVGWPVFRLPATDVARVEVSRIEPLTEFGGWGLRWAPGRFGIVMRAGEALVATRHDGRLFAVTVDDARTAAAALEAARNGEGTRE
ncbi:DUF1648 domain-containing protein [Leucobacter allii]|uniref:DUF1648 domain-containing protein n=1 Tax=Leucobacter allii TaxID=2932247 RepID=A0ABY4FIB4_9MICO|nr:DUF1648 domain-containing protein [Leucobacter allii]UOQ56248.1 DUF1648 domain-containing protein [Leucobacter allii]